MKNREPSHFDHLIRLLELERAEERLRHRAQVGSSLRERIASGFTLADLALTDERRGLGGRILLDLARKDAQPLTSRWDVGQTAELRPNRAPEAPGAHAVVSKSTRTTLQVALDHPPEPPLLDGLLQLDQAANDSTHRRTVEAVRQVQAMEKGALRHRRELLLGREAPRYDRVEKISPRQKLNPEQVSAVERALAAEDFFLVHGPPGTGKSTVLTEIAIQSVRRGRRVLMTAPSNAAVDHLLEACLEQGLSALRVGHPARIADRLLSHALDVAVEQHPDRILARNLMDEAFDLLGYARKQRSQGRSRERFANARRSSAEARSMLDEARALERKALASLLDSAEVVCATCAGLGSPWLSEQDFDLVLFDEATQATEPLSLLPFLRAPRMVFAGDPKQLPPTVLSEQAAKEGLSVSLFERLLEEQGAGHCELLKEQHRMHEQIMRFPSGELYGGALRAHPEAAGRTLEGLIGPGTDSPPLLYLDTAGKGFDEAVEPDTDSLLNPGEASLIASRAVELLARGLAPSQIGIIAPYRAQVACLRGLLPDEAIEIDTVDAFQGREKEAVLLTLTRSNPDGALGFLKDIRRMNVAITRARRHLFVVGDSATLSSHPFYARFIEAAQGLGGYRSAWEWPA